MERAYNMCNVQVKQLRNRADEDARLIHMAMQMGSEPPSSLRKDLEHLMILVWWLVFGFEMFAPYCIVLHEWECVRAFARSASSTVRTRLAWSSVWSSGVRQSPCSTRHLLDHFSAWPCRGPLTNRCVFVYLLIHFFLTSQLCAVTVKWWREV